MIPQSFITELLARVDIVAVIGRHLTLKKRGAHYVGLCPFHGEKTPSFTVSPVRQTYHCFGCGMHGSAIGFLMEHAQLGYVDAINQLAGELGMSVPREPLSPAAERAAREAPALTDLLLRCAQFYKSRLKDSERAIAYLRGRGLTGQTAARYAIGYAPASWRNLEAAVADYDSDMLVAAGLVIDQPAQSAVGADSAPAGDADGRRRRYDRFRDRIMFPIRNPRGQVIGFGGRVLDTGEPKYLNSPETALFSKGRELYGLFEARSALRRENQALVVEGYMDVVILAQHGFDYAVATLGTATSGAHINKLLRLVDRVVFAFDGDAAGRKAAWRALQASLPELPDTKRIDFLFLPPEHDPDSFVRALGRDAFAQALAGAMSLSEFLIHALAQDNDTSSAEGRARFQAQARPLLLALAATALRQQLVHAVAARLGISAAEFAQYLSESAGPPAAGAAPPQRPVVTRAAPAASRGRWERTRPSVGATRAALPDLSFRVQLLSALHPSLAARWRQREPIDLDDAGNPWLPAELVRWLGWLGELPEQANFAAVSAALAEHDAALRGRLEQAAAAEPADLALDEAATEFDDALVKLQQRTLKLAIQQLVDQPDAPLVQLRARRAHLQGLIDRLSTAAPDTAGT